MRDERERLRDILDIVWLVVEAELPNLKREIEAVLGES